MKRILRDARVIQMNPAVVIGAKQANLNLQLANLLSFAACRFANHQSFEPSIVKRAAGIEVEMARIGSKRINMLGQFVAD
jgi:hypothetical protein